MVQTARVPKKRKGCNKYLNKSQKNAERLLKALKEFYVPKTVLDMCRMTAGKRRTTASKCGTSPTKASFGGTLFCGWKQGNQRETTILGGALKNTQAHTHTMEILQGSNSPSNSTRGWGSGHVYPGLINLQWEFRLLLPGPTP